MKKQIILLFTLLLVASGCVSTTQNPWANRPYTAPAEQAPSTLSVPPEDPAQPWNDNDPAQQAAAIERTQIAAADRQAQSPTTGYGQSANNGGQSPALTIENATAPIMPTVKIALLVPLSGKHADLGQALLQSSQIALFDMGYSNIEIMPRDTQGTAQGARQAAQDALRSGAQLILGPLFADSVSAVRSVLRGRDINMIAFSTDWTLAGGNSYIMGFLPFAQVQRVINYAAQKGYRDIGVLAPDNQYGNAVLAAYTNFAYRDGIHTVATARYAENGYNLSDVTRQFARYDERSAQKDAAAAAGQQVSQMILPAPFNAVLMPTGGADARAVSNMLSYYDLPPESVRRLGTGLLDDESLSTEQSLRGTWFAAPDPAARAAFERRYREIYRLSPPRLATLAYDATALAAILAQTSYYRTGRVAFDRAALTNPNGFAGIDGIFRFRPDGLIERGLAVLEIHDGQIDVIDPAPNSFIQR